MINCFSCDIICFNKEHYCYTCGFCHNDTPYCSSCRKVLEVVLDDKYFRCRVCNQLSPTESLILKVPNKNQNLFQNQNISLNSLSNFNNVENLNKKFVNLDFRGNNQNNNSELNQNQINNNHVFYDNNTMMYASRPFQMRIHEINDNSLNESLNINKDNRVKYNQEVDFFNNKSNDLGIIKSNFSNISSYQGKQNFSFNGINNEYSQNMKIFNPNSLNPKQENILNVNNNSVNSRFIDNTVVNKPSLNSILSLNSNNSNSFQNKLSDDNIYRQNDKSMIKSNNINMRNINNLNLSNSQFYGNNLNSNKVEYDYSSVKRLNSNFSLDIENKLKTPDKLSISPEKYKISNKLSSGKHDAHGTNMINSFMIDDNISNIASKKTVQTSFEDLYEAINSNNIIPNYNEKYSNFINNGNYISINDQVEQNIVKNDNNYSLLSSRNNMKLSFSNIINKANNNINGNISSKLKYYLIRF